MMEKAILSHTYAVIMAGGGGTRLWPVSRRSAPKQALKLLGKDSLFQSTVKRLEGLFPPERILVVTVEEQEELLKAQAPALPDENFLLEPEPMGTASVVGLAATVLQKRDPQAIMVVLPSDHFIRNRDLFYLLLKVAVDVAEEDYLVTLGITPTFPATGYGYIQRDERIRGSFAYPVYTVKGFKEKPDKERALEMVHGGGYSWNSGMFIWRTQTILSEFERQMPALKASLDKIGASLGTPQSDSVIQSIWPTLENQTIDYGVMENAQKVAVLPASGLDWSDVGSWDSLFGVLPSDENGNINFAGEHIALETRNSLVYGNGDKRLVVTIGVDDLVIIDSGDVLLVARRDQAQDVRKVVKMLKENKREDYT